MVVDPICPLDYVVHFYSKQSSVSANALIISVKENTTYWLSVKPDQKDNLQQFHKNNSCYMLTSDI